jgi:hypothetical protein
LADWRLSARLAGAALGREHGHRSLSEMPTVAVARPKGEAMKTLIFAVFAQLLDMFTTWWGQVHGAIERNALLPSFLGGIIAIKLSLIVLLIALYVLYRRTKYTRVFNIMIAAPSLWIFTTGMVNLSMEWR